MRSAYNPAAGDPFTTNAETNDQPLGHFGTVTVEISSQDSGNTYTLDAEIDGTTLERVYFPKGGWVDFYSCEVGEDFTGDCEDEEGRWWTLEGESSWSSTDSTVDEEEKDDAGAYDEWYTSEADDEEADGSGYD